MWPFKMCISWYCYNIHAVTFTLMLSSDNVLMFCSGDPTCFDKLRTEVKRKKKLHLLLEILGCRCVCLLFNMIELEGSTFEKLKSNVIFQDIMTWLIKVIFRPCCVWNYFLSTKLHHINVQMETYIYPSVCLIISHPWVESVHSETDWKNEKRKEKRSVDYFE